MTTPRDLDRETSNTADHQYAYDFDFDVMHPMMVRAFRPFFRPGRILELGSFKGDFTRRLMPHFPDITCVEGSGAAVAEARAAFGDKVVIHHALFEQVALSGRFENIVMTHVLEHLDDPVAVLRRVNDEWLAPGGRFFLVCPNALAASRQIAVKMGLVGHPEAVTPSEAAHGHRVTYTSETLARDATSAGLKVVHRSGIFFKALANFQWDRLLKTDIVSPAYLDGCYELGKEYPELCASILLVCARGDDVDPAKAS
jgi:2-polyprenyl-3-methyl-5-hydroxy-6-metoxy-1,4-benzoquinol methylase